MICERCGSSNVTIDLVQTGSTTKSRYKTKQRGCLGSLIWVLCFGWVIALFKPKKHRTSGTSKTTFTTQKIALCHDCGYSWEVKNENQKKRS